MSLTPLCFQRRVAELLLSGRNVILQAPTGAGKTYAAELPYLMAREQGLDFPRKCVYAVPMRVLANQFVDERGDRPYRVSIQTGERREDPRFEADLTFATIDQVLSSFLLAPYSLGRRSANLNAGAIVSSYLVFDEFHLYEPQAMLPTTLEMLRMLRGVAPFLLMTATFSREMLHGLAQLLDAVVVPEDDAARDEMQQLESQAKVRRYHLAGEPLAADAVLAGHERRTLAICNTVARAQALYRALRAHPALEDTQVRLLHSRFLPADRKRIEEEVRRLYAKGNADAGRYIVVATQAIEVGLDITCEHLHTELAPANAILQRAGRCARYKDETGDVHVYGSVLGSDGEAVDLAEKPAPYMHQEGVIRATRDALADRNGQPLRFSDEQELVSIVLGPGDRHLVEGLAGGRETHRYKMNGMMSGDAHMAGDLVRDVVSQPVAVYDDPQAMLERPFAWESFSLHPGTVQGMVKEWLERLDEPETELDSMGLWAICSQEAGEEEAPDRYRWFAVTSAKDAAGAALLVVHPALATYSPEMGFVSDHGGTYRAACAPARDAAGRQSYGYCLESWRRHAELVWHEGQSVWPTMAYAARHLEQRAGWAPGTLDRLAHLTLLLHDTGKLNRGWQQWVRTYQQAIGRPVAGGFYAHTDSVPGDPRREEAERRAGHRPAHAVESALAAAPILLAWGPEGDDSAPGKAAFSAISRHHGAFSAQAEPFRLDKGAAAEIQATLADAGLSDLWVDEGIWESMAAEELADLLRDLWVNPEIDADILAYMLLARLLRLADTRGTAAGSQSAREQAQ